MLLLLCPQPSQLYISDHVDQILAEMNLRFLGHLKHLDLDIYYLSSSKQAWLLQQLWSWILPSRYSRGQEDGDSQLFPADIISTGRRWRMLRSWVKNCWTWRWRRMVETCCGIASSTRRPRVKDEACYALPLGGHPTGKETASMTPCAPRSSPGATQKWISVDLSGGWGSSSLSLSLSSSFRFNSLIV